MSFGVFQFSKLATPRPFMRDASKTIVREFFVRFNKNLSNQNFIYWLIKISINFYTKTIIDSFCFLTVINYIAIIQFSCFHLLRLEAGLMLLVCRPNRSPSSLDISTDRNFLRGGGAKMRRHKRYFSLFFYVF